MDEWFSYGNQKQNQNNKYRDLKNRQKKQHKLIERQGKTLACHKKSQTIQTDASHLTRETKERTEKTAKSKCDEPARLMRALAPSN